ncbi:GtrA family protein [Candidatus Soleaferrea massiliensis]|uniref:GtrA family protein n=1 Tax=Candidatus Soleaferrea massiliensis TaxID=1470354 RepID=UPI00058B08E0|nr:GtrA family protein [Candidatus Soleaferrea massiliensis]
MLKKLLIKYKEIILYVFFGGLTTVVNFSMFFIFNMLLGEDRYIVSQVISWVAAVLFAFITNKLFVFSKTERTFQQVYREFLKFVSVRILTGLLETISLIAAVDALHFPVNWSKIIICFAVVILNYVFSKLLIFTSKKPEV